MEGGFSGNLKAIGGFLLLTAVLLALALWSRSNDPCDGLTGRAFEHCDYAEYLKTEGAAGGSRPAGYP